MEKYAKQKLLSNQADKMLMLMVICVSIISLNSLKCKQNNKDTLKLINMIAQL